MFKPRIDSHFGLADLVSPVSSPRFINCVKVKKPEYKISFSQTSLGPKTYHIKILGLVKSINSTDELMGKIPHETVCNLIDGGSDMKLYKLGLIGKDTHLSPDYVSTDKKLFIEVATTRSPVPSALKDRFQEKIVHYTTVATTNKYDIGVIVVSPDSVYTNLEMSQESVDALCFRFRAGLAIHSKIEVFEGRPLYQENKSSQQRIVEGVIRELGSTRSELKTSKHFPIHIISDFAKPPTKKELFRAAKLIKRCGLEARQRSTNSKEDLQKYISSFGPECRVDDKRISNIPMVIRRDGDTSKTLDLDHESSNMPGWLKHLWNDSKKVNQYIPDKQKERDEAMGRSVWEQHRVQKTQCFKASLDEVEKIESSKTGLFGKSMSKTAEYLDHRAKSKLSFHPINSPTKDIEDFISRDNLRRSENPSVPSDIVDMMTDAKSMWESNPLSLQVFKNFSRLDLISHASLVTSLFTEICYCYKYWIKRADFYKKWCGNVQMLIRCTGDHTFVAYAFPKSEFSKWDTGKIGPTMFESDNYYFSDFCSYNEPNIEHFVKAGPYMLSILSHLQSNMETPIDQINTFSQHVSKTMSGIYLLFLNNKTDSEELMTSQRYLNMAVLEDLDPNPYKFVKRLPEVFRSRLTCYLFKRTVSEMERFASRSPKKIPIVEDGVASLEYDWLQGIFSGESISFRQKVNEFYFGYVVSKERGRGADRNFKIMKKIVEQEYKYLDDDHPVFTDMEDVKDNQTHISLLKSLLHLFKMSLEDRYGDEWKTVMKTNLVDKLASLNFVEIATLKVSSRNYDHKMLVPDLNHNMSTQEIRQLLSEHNPEDVRSRPKVMQSLANCVKQYLQDTGDTDVSHVTQLVPWALKSIERRGFFYSDIFPKPQHGGDREIHVLEFKARLIQLYVERISRTLCEMTGSDSLTHPKLKESFIKTHYNLAESELPSARMTFGKSADASKWCQRNHVSKFAAVLVGILPPEFHVGIMRILWFWTCKVIVFPIQFAANFLSNSDVVSNPIYTRMRNEFYSGTGIFPDAKTNRMVIRSGMMQGILHYTSSLVHAVVQEAMARIQQRVLTAKGYKSVITVIQGSDDSAQLISLSGGKWRDLAAVATRMLQWKERVAKNISIYCSYEKSCIGSSDMIEYNSEWSIRKTTFKPTFRWVSACLEVGIVEKFIDRLSNFYSTCTTVLEGGGSVFEASLIQLSQAWMHYWMLGVGNHTMSSSTVKLLKLSKDPSLGYYPLDSDYSAGIPGLDFLLYLLYKTTDYGHSVNRGLIPEYDVDTFPEDVKDVSVSRDLRKAVLRFGNHKIFEKIVKGMDVPALEKLVIEAENNPELIYYPESTWDGSKTRIFLKVFEPGVKESLSKHSSTARILSASAYIISRPCLTMMEGAELKKVSLYRALMNDFRSKLDPSHRKLPIQDVFVHHKEYEDLFKTITSFQNNLTVQSVKLRSRSKHVITVLEREMFDVSVTELCKEAWFERGGRTGLSSSQVQVKWTQLKKMYPFLKDSMSETARSLNMNNIQLKNFIDSLNDRPRQITLLDSAAKGGSLRTVISRVFWPCTKLHLKEESLSTETISSIRSQLFSICSHWMPPASKIRCISELLSESTILSSRDPPSRLAKLSIMKRSMTGESSYTLIKDILRMKLGSVGFFTISQDGWGWNRKGYGEWKGKILESSCIIEFKDSVCTSITLDKIVSASELGRMLKEFVESTCSSFPEELKESDHWLSSDGKINGGRGYMAAIPIKMNSELRIQIFDELHTKDWFIETSHNIIRLKAAFSKGVNITILSDKFYSYEWDPQYQVDKSKEYSSWNNSEPMSLADLTNEFSSLFNGSRSQVLRELKQINTKTTSSGWSLQDFRISLSNFYTMRTSARDLSPVATDLVLTKEQDDWIEAITSGNFEFDWETTGVFEEPDKDEGADIMDFEMDEEDAQRIDNLMELLASEREENIKQDQKTMPTTNRCFSNLDTLSRAFTTVSLRDNVIDFKENSHYSLPGILGKILTLLVGRDCMVHGFSEDEQEASKLEEESVSLMTSIRSNKILDDMSIEALEDNLAQLESQLSFASDFIRLSLLETKQRLLRILQYKRSPPRIEAIGDISSNIFLERCRPLISKASPKLEMISELESNFYLPLIRSELDKLVVKLSEGASISPQQESIYRESVAKPVLTTLLIDLVSEICKTQLKVGDYATSSDESEWHVFSLSDLT